MCESVMTLASNTDHTSLSPTCSANADCDGVNCLLLVAGGTYYVETLILPCNDSIELVVRDSRRQVLFTTIFNETGVRPLVIGFVTVTVDATIISRNYSMDVRVSC